MPTEPTIALDAHEVALLRRALDAYLEELTFTASRAEQRDVKDELWKFEHELVALRRRLGGPAAA